MFALFYSLYFAMFTGSFYLYNHSQIGADIKVGLNKLGELATSIFGDNQVLNFGENVYVNDWLCIVSFVLALITSIGIVVMAVKGIRRVFGVFFMGLR